MRPPAAKGSQEAAEAHRRRDPGTLYRQSAPSTQKPLSALLPLIESFSLPEGTVLDPFRRFRLPACLPPSCVVGAISASSSIPKSRTRGSDD